MRWQHKAKIMRICANLPGGGRLYRQIQKNFGQLKVSPMARLAAQVEMAKWIIDAWGSVKGKRFFEVGTGHIPIVPIGLFLCGAGLIVTVDLHRRIEYGLTRDSLRWISCHRKEIFAIYREVVDEVFFDDRFALLCKYKNDPSAFFHKAGIKYWAPMDAADTRLPEQSVDCHFSINVLEHIPQIVIKDIFIEAKRILKPDGITIHFIDLSDHFQHQDNSISKINFLRYSEDKWEKIAGNQFAYCNRMRINEYTKLFRKIGFNICRAKTELDQQSLEELKNGFMVDEIFKQFNNHELCTIQFKVALQKISKHQSLKCKASDKTIILDDFEEIVAKPSKE